MYVNKYLLLVILNAKQDGHVAPPNSPVYQEEVPKQQNFPAKLEVLIYITCNLYK